MQISKKNVCQLSKIRAVFRKMLQKMATVDFKGVLFDLDGTLVDNYSAIHITTCEAFKKFGIPAPTRDTIVKTVGGSILITMQRLLANTEFSDIYADVADVYMGLFPNYVFYDLRLMPFAKELLKALKEKGLKLACFTNKQQEGADAILEKLGLLKCLDCVVATTLHSPRKPDKVYTEYALNKIGLTSPETLVVGDSPFDYKAAKVCDVACALVATGGDEKQFLVEQCPDAVGVFDNLALLSEKIFDVKF